MQQLTAVFQAIGNVAELDGGIRHGVQDAGGTPALHLVRLGR